MENVLDIAKFGIEGRVMSWEVVNSDGSIDNACYTPKSNLILDCGLDMFPTVSAIDQIYTYFAIGTGTADPLVTDTKLTTEYTYGSNRNAYGTVGNYSAYNSVTIPTAGTDPYVITIQKGFQSTTGSLNGTHYTELGFSPLLNHNTNLFSKFRIQDGSGNPVSVSVDVTQQLRIKYQLLVKLTPVTLTHNTTTITGIGSFGYTSGWQQVTSSYIDAVQIITGAGSRSLYCCSALTLAPLIGNAPTRTMMPNPGGLDMETYTPGSHYIIRGCTYETLQNVGTIVGIIGIYGDYFWGALFDTPIVKPDTHKLTFRLRFSWARGV